MANRKEKDKWKCNYTYYFSFPNNIPKQRIWEKCRKTAEEKGTRATTKS